MRPTKANKGFTLVELVVTMVVVAVLALGVTSFINYGAEIYRNSTAWDQQMGQLRLASNRFSREVSQAVPGTVAVSADCISFNPIESAERFFANPVVGTLDTLQSYKPRCCTGSDCSGCEASEVVLLEGYQPHFYQIDNITISSCGTDCEQAVIQLDSNINPSTYASSGRVFFAQPQVEWCVVVDQIQRNGELIGEGLTNDTNSCANNGSNDPQCPFVAEPPTLGRNNLVRLQWWFDVNGAPQRWAQEAQLANVP